MGSSWMQSTHFLQMSSFGLWGGALSEYREVWEGWAVDVGNDMFLVPQDLYMFANSALNIADANTILLDPIPAQSVPSYLLPCRNTSPLVVPVCTIDCVRGGEEILVWHGADFADRIKERMSVLLFFLLFLFFFLLTFSFLNAGPASPAGGGGRRIRPDIKWLWWWWFVWTWVWGVQMSLVSCLWHTFFSLSLFICNLSLSSATTPKKHKEGQEEKLPQETRVYSCCSCCSCCSCPFSHPCCCWL